MCGIKVSVVYEYVDIRVCVCNKKNVCDVGVCYRSVYVCMHTWYRHLYMCVFRCVHFCECILKPEFDIGMSFLNLFPILILRQGLSLNRKFINFATLFGQ